MCRFIIQTLTDPAIFWSALEAVATVFALIFIFIELKRLRRESTENKIEGLKFAAERLEAEDFRSSCERIISAVKRSDEVFPEEIMADLVPVFARLDFISKLVKLNYINQGVLLSFKGNELFILERMITNLENKTNSQIPSLKSSYPGGYDLLKAASRFKP